MDDQSNSSQRETLAGLGGKLAADFRTWIDAETELAKAQIQVVGQESQTAATAMIAAASFGLVGIFILAIALVDLLALYIARPWAGLIIAGAFCLIALVLLLVGRAAAARAGRVAKRIGGNVTSTRDWT
ncbi:hypothetical protein BH10PSE7_BH10PSE7_42680 [soil metagenome]